MDRLKKASSAIEQLDALKGQLSVFESGCKSLLANIERDEFFSREIASTVKSSLESIMDAEIKLKGIYEELALGSMPDKIGETLDRIEKFSAELSAKGAFIDAASFFKRLHSHDSTIEAIINEERGRLSSFDIDAMAADEAKDSLQKYVDFKSFYEGHHELLGTVSQSFAYQLVLKAVDSGAFYIDEVKNDDAKPEAVGEEAEKSDESKSANDVSAEECSSEVNSLAEAGALTDNQYEKQALSRKDSGDEQPALSVKLNCEGVLSSVKISAEVTRSVAKEIKEYNVSKMKREFEEIMHAGLKISKLFNLAVFAACDARLTLLTDFEFDRENIDKQLVEAENNLSLFNKYGYLAKFDLGQYGITYLATAKCMTFIERAFNGQIQKGMSIKGICDEAHAEERKSHITLLDNIVAGGNYALLALSNAISQLLLSFDIVSGEYRGSSRIDIKRGFIAALHGIKINESEEKILFIGYQSQEQQGLEYIIEQVKGKEKWWSAGSVIVTIGFAVEQAKALLKCLADNLGDELNGKKQLYYGLDDKKLIDFATSKAVTDLSELFGRVETETEVVADESESKDVTDEVEPELLEEIMADEADADNGDLLKLLQIPDFETLDKILVGRQVIPEIKEEIEKSSKPVTAAIVKKERKVLGSRQLDVNTLNRISRDLFVCPEYLLLFFGRRDNMPVTKHIERYKATLDYMYIYGYAKKYDCGRYGTFYAATDRFLKLTLYPDKIPQKLIEEKSIWDKPVEQAPWNLMVLTMGLYDMFVSLKAKYFNNGLSMVSRCECGFIVTEFEFSNGNSKERLVSITISYDENTNFQELSRFICENMIKADEAAGVLFAAFDSQSVKAFIGWLNSTFSDVFADVPEYYYLVGEKKLYCYEDDKEVTSIAELHASIREKSALNHNKKDAALQVKDPEPISVTDVETLKDEENSEDIATEVTNEDLPEKISEETAPVEETVESKADEDVLSRVKAEPVTDETTNVKEESQAMSEVDKAHYLEQYHKILMTGKPYCACAYLRSLAGRDLSFNSEYMQLAYAVNDPLAGCSYISSKLIETFIMSESGFNSNCLAAAMLRNFYSNQYQYDYDIERLMDSVAENELLAGDVELRKLINIFRKFKKSHNAGMAKYAFYKKSNTHELKDTLEKLSLRAEKEKILASDSACKSVVTNMRLAKALEYLFNEQSDITSILTSIIHKETDKDTVELVHQYLADNIIKDGTEIAPDNISSFKLEDLMKKAWEEGGNQVNNKQGSSKISGFPRRKLLHRLENISALMCEYVVVAGRINEDASADEDFPAYQRAYKEVVPLIKGIISRYEAISATCDADFGYRQVLIYTLKEIASLLEGKVGEFTGRYFYLPFLGDDNVLLDESYIPVFRDIKDLPEMSTLSRIERHAFRGGERFETITGRIEAIKNGDNNVIGKVFSEDNYGSVSLILRHINETVPGFEEDFYKANDIDTALEYARKQADVLFKSFADDLELYQSYGRIDNTEENKKEIILQLVDVLHESAIEDENFGFFKKVLEAFRTKIKTDAELLGKNLEHNLDVFISDHKELLENASAAAAVEKIRQSITSQKYSSAEELLNRLENNDFDNLSALDIEDYFGDFINHYDSYIKGVADSQRTLDSLMRVHINNKDTRAADRLLKAWPKSNADATEAKVTELLSAFGFNVGSVEKRGLISNRFNDFTVKLKKATGGRQNNYNHPVPAFGSLGETDGFRVVYIFGKYDAENLLEIFGNIGDAKNTIVILDFALKESVRRRLALLVKGKANGRIFAVIDRVVAKCIIENYTEQTVNKRLLQIIMPYAYYQPYVAESSKAMPSELFIGRKEELKKIKDVNGVNIVYGGRQLGKSALLMKAKKDVDNNESGDRAVYIDIKGLDYEKTALKISQELVLAKILKDSDITSDWRTLSMSIRKRLMSDVNPIHYFLLLLDEADAFIKSCQSVKYEPFDALKDIQSAGEGRFKFVVAGLRDVVRFDRAAALSDNSVLPQLGSLTVKPFKFAEAKELLEYPLFYLGYRFKDDQDTDALVAAILGHTNSFPGMIQLYCTKLIEAMKKGYAGYAEADTPPYNVSEDHIKKILGEKHLQEEIRQKYFITLTVGDDNYYLLIAMITAYLYNSDDGDVKVTPADVLQFARDYDIKDIASLTIENVTALMEEMRELNVLQHNGEHGYRFTRYSFYQMMGTKAHLEDELTKYMGGDIDE